MKHCHYAEVPSHELALPGAKDASIRALLGGDDVINFVMLMLEIRPGGHTPLHSHEWEEEIFVKSGKGVLETDGEKVPLKAGDALILDPGRSHRFMATGDEPLEFICIIPKRGRV